jgi:peptidoglycan hydrolase-like protein with peptidoglycan-binding domain
LSVALGRAGRYAVVLMVIALLAMAAPALASSGGASFIPGFANSQVKSGISGQLGSRVLRVGRRGHDVRVLQAYLTVAGFGTVVDGDFGQQTKRNVIAFQRARGLTATGVVTLAVARALEGLVAQIQALPPTGTTRINADGTATAPAGAPATVVAVVAAANQIISSSYCYAGGHSSWKSSCYDCSGSVSYALHGGGLLSTPEDSTQFETYGDPGPGRWITIYADPSHAFLVVAGRAFNTAAYGGPNIPAGTGPRWRYDPLGNLADGGHYVVRHPPGL